MKKKEIDIYLDDYKDLDQFMKKEYFTGSIYSKSGLGGSIKAKLVIEIPEQELVITESAFDFAVTKVYASNGHVSFIQLKKELGFK